MSTGRRPPKPPGNQHWTDTQRAEWGSKHRDSQKLAPIVDPEPSSGQVGEMIDDEFTQPVELTLRAKQHPHSPASVEDMLEVWARIDRFKSEARQKRQSDANQLLGVTNAPKIDAERLKSLEWKVKILWGLLVAALTLAGGSVFTITKYLYTSGGDSREAAINMRNLVERSLDNQKRIQLLERPPMPTTTTTTTKGTGTP